MDFTAERREELRQLIVAKGLRRGMPVQLVGGTTSPFYFDLRSIVMHGPSMPLVGAAYQSLLEDPRFSPTFQVGGPATGAIAPATLLAFHRTTALDFPTNAFYTRTEAKAHGLQNTLEGFTSGQPVVLIEDVTTSGNSLLKSAAVVRTQRVSILGALSLIDRGAGAKEALARAGIPLQSVFTLDDFTDHLPS